MSLVGIGCRDQPSRWHVMIDGQLIGMISSLQLTPFSVDLIYIAWCRISYLVLFHALKLSN